MADPLKWRTDLAACGGEGCALRDSCQRHLAHRHIQAGNQTYMAPPDGECREYWPEVIATIPEDAPDDLRLARALVLAISADFIPPTGD